MKPKPAYASAADLNFACMRFLLLEVLGCNLPANHALNNLFPQKTSYWQAVEGEIRQYKTAEV